MKESQLQGGLKRPEHTTEMSVAMLRKKHHALCVQSNDDGVG